MNTGHPNAIASLVTTGLAYAIYRITSHYSWLHVSSANALLIAGGIITGVLFIGKRGIRPTLSAVWHGADSAVSGPPAAKKAAKPAQAPPAP